MKMGQIKRVPWTKHGDETVRWSGVVHQLSENNVGGKGSSFAFEQVHRVTPSPEIPSGTYVAFEDLPASGSDWNYQDDLVVFIRNQVEFCAPVIQCCCPG